MLPLVITAEFKIIMPCDAWDVSSRFHLSSFKLFYAKSCMIFIKMVPSRFYTVYIQIMTESNLS